MMFYEKLKKIYKKKSTPMVTIIDDENLSEQNYAIIQEAEKLKTFTIKKGIITNNILKLSAIPVIYLVSSILVIFTLLFLNFRLNSIANSKKPVGDIYLGIPDFYQLPKINPTISHIYTIISTFSGFSIVIILFSILKQRFKVPEYRQHSFKLYIMLFFGMMSNFLNLLKGFFPFMEKIKIIPFVNEIQDDMKLKLLFLGLLCFSFLFAFYSITILFFLKNNKEDELKEYQTCNSLFNLKFEEDWLNYKIIILFFLTIFALVYVLFLMHHNKLFMLAGSYYSLFLETKATFVINVFPYFLHLMNSILMFSFYFELKYLNIALSQNLEVDYLFESSEKEKELIS
jgi:hypothetical protein